MCLSTGHCRMSHRSVAVARRYLVQDSVSVLVKGKWRKWEIIDKAIEQEGWKLLVLLRLSPIVPYNLLNITMAATKIPFWPFALASFFGEPFSAERFLAIKRQVDCL